MKPELRCRWEAGSIVTTGGFTTATQHGISGTPVNITENTPETTKRGAPGRSEAKPGRIVLDPGRAHGGAGKPNGFVGIVLGKMGKSGNCFLFLEVLEVGSSIVFDISGILKIQGVVRGPRWQRDAKGGKS